MKHLRKTYGVPIVRVALSCSLLAIAALALSGPFSDLDARLKAAGGNEQKLEILSNSEIGDRDFGGYVSKATAKDPQSIRDATDYVELMAMAESAGKPGDPSSQIKEIKSSSLYRDMGEKQSANWLDGAIRRMKNLFDRKTSPKQESFGSGPNLPDLSFVIYIVWFLLGAAVLAFIAYAVRFINFGKMRKRRAKAMLEDNEPERTLDEWLAMADTFEREGKFREAVRSLYLACLLKFDERNIARFVRSQTNWEHLSRIESSPRKPTDLDFRSPTQAFDRIWYGHQVRGAVDVDDFRAWYQKISAMLQERAA